MQTFAQILLHNYIISRHIIILYTIIIIYYYIVIQLIILTANLLIADKIMHIISIICANA